MKRQVECLVVGAGAVGAVYAYYLALGGAKVTFYIREKHRENIQGGIKLFCHNKKQDSIRLFKDFDIVTSAAEVRAKKWDQVFLTFSSTALRKEESLALLRQINRDATMVLLQPGIEDFTFLAQHFPRENIVRGMISLISYQAPLSGENLEPCVAYWFPPLTANPFTGRKELVQKVLDSFPKGGMPVSYVTGLDATVAYATAYFMPFLAALEKNNWSFAALKKSGDLKAVSRAAEEAGAAISLETRLSKPVTLNLVGAPLVSIALGLQEFFTPLNMEVYFQYHFTKVKDQTLLYLNNYKELCAKHHLPMDNLAALTGYVRA